MPFKVPQEWLYVIDVSPYQDLKDIMDPFVEQNQLSTKLGVPTRAAGNRKGPRLHGPSILSMYTIAREMISTPAKIIVLRRVDFFIGVILRTSADSKTTNNSLLYYFN